MGSKKNLIKTDTIHNAIKIKPRALQTLEETWGSGQLIRRSFLNGRFREMQPI